MKEGQGGNSYAKKYLLTRNCVSSNDPIKKYSLIAKHSMDFTTLFFPVSFELNFQKKLFKFLVETIFSISS